MSAASSEERFDRLQELFEAARHLPAAAQQALLERECADDPGLRARVERLLAFADPEPSSGDVATTAAPASLLLPDGRHAAAAMPEWIGPYRILHPLGEGGMGVVYLAEQQAPVKRRVALKVIKLGMDSKAVLARFDAERHALALMEHSAVARIYDAGTTDRGQPWFAMEFVKGIPITTYCDQNELSIAQRLALFRTVCSGIQHAHLRGVMHRDIKPSNVLVTLQDGEPAPKIIDFGLAKAVDHRLVEATLFTEHGQVIGTPEYMSPEQAGLGGLDVDTRTDIYSLGVLLYELLTGALPFERSKLLQAGYAEMQRIIRETEPKKPSTRITPRSEWTKAVAKHRRLPPSGFRVDRLDGSAADHTSFYWNSNGTIENVGTFERLLLRAEAGSQGMLHLTSEWLGYPLYTHIARAQVLDPATGTALETVTGNGSSNVFTFPTTDTYVIVVSAIDYNYTGWFSVGVSCQSASACDTQAQSWNYGVGYPGTLGVPSLTASSLPRLGTIYQLDIGNSLGSPTTTMLLIGLSSANSPVPGYGGTLLVQSPAILVGSLPAGGQTVPIPLPNSAFLIGLGFAAQSIVTDSGAQYGFAFSRGLLSILGN